MLVQSTRNRVSEMILSGLLKIKCHAYQGRHLHHVSTKAGELGIRPTVMFVGRSKIS